MDIFLHDPGDIPLPPDKVHIRELRPEPYPDQRRVRIVLEVTPFQKRPNFEIQVTDGNGNIVASLSIIESIDAKMDFTVHLQGAEQPFGEFIASAEIYYYEDEQTQDAPDTNEEGKNHQLPSRVNIVDRRQTTFVIGEQSNLS
jgi:hypothetical protein